MTEPIYLDYNATTPPAPEVLDAVGAALRDLWGNPSSDHPYGHAAHAAIESARGEVAALLDASPGEIVFTSGGTESDNAALIGVAEAREQVGRHLVTSAIEHPAIEATCRYLESRGWSVTRVGVDADGRVDAGEVASAIRDDTALVSIMHSNNETGTLQPVAEIADIARARKVPFHTDAAQSVGKVPVSVEGLGVDLLTVAGHKLYGPKGVGALYIREGTPFCRVLHGADHERGRRAGTENAPLIVGLGAACRLARKEMTGRVSRAAALRDRLVGGLRGRFPGLVVHGERAERLPNTAFVALPGHPAAELMARLDGVATAAGAACHAGEAHVSYVLRAMGVADAVALATLRLTVGRPTTEDDVDEALRRIGRAAGIGEETRP